MTVIEWLRQAQSRLGAVTEAPRLEAQILAAHVLLVDRSWLLAHPEHEFNELAGEALLQRRESHEPLAYILGYREFYGRRFRVTPAVLIPRQDTEILVEATIGVASFFQKSVRVLDIGAGSGAIAITLKLERPAWEVTALEDSPSAIEVAQGNAEALGAEVRFVTSDLFAAIPEESFDVIVSNPPYIGLAETLPREVRDFEPHGALFSGESGIEFYVRIAEEAANHLNPKGRLLLEVGYSQAHVVTKLFESLGWRQREIVKDLSGIERVLVFGKTD